MEWERLFNYGLPTVMLFCVLGSLWRAASWAKSNIVEPVVKSHLSLIDSLNVSLPAQIKSLEDVKNTAALVASDHARKLDAILMELHLQTDVLKRSIDRQTKVMEDDRRGT